MRYRLAAIAAVRSILGLTFPAWAGEWVQGENGQWVYKENKEPLEGWNRINETWYCLGAETGVWVEEPSMVAEATCRLLENKLVGMETYQDEEELLQFKVDYENSKMIQVLVRCEEKPDVFHRTNTHKIDKKRGAADPVMGEREFPLW